MVPPSRPRKKTPAAERRKQVAAAQRKEQRPADQHEEQRPADQHEEQRPAAERGKQVPAADRKEHLWRWLGLTVGGTALPFGVFALAYALTAGRGPTLEQILGRGELFIPSSVMNVEAMLIFKNVTLSGRSFWYPTVLVTCGLAALGGALCYGIIAALNEAPPKRVEVFPITLQQLKQTATVFSAAEFSEALVLGTLGVTLFILLGGRRNRARE